MGSLKVTRVLADMEFMQERRTESRMLCADMLEIRWTEDSGRKRQAIGLLEDISQSGACLQMESPIPAGAEISWESPDQWFAGVVRHCVYREIGYFVGVEFYPGFKWSEQTFQPQHLLNVKDLAEGVHREVSETPKRTSSGLTIQ